MLRVFLIKETAKESNVKKGNQSHESNNGKNRSDGFIPGLKRKVSLILFQVVCRIVLGIGLIIMSGCGGGNSGTVVTQRQTLNDVQLEQIRIIGSNISNQVQLDMQSSSDADAYAKAAQSAKNLTGVNQAIAGPNSLTVLYTNGAIDQWITPTPPREPVDFQKRMSSALSGMTRSRSTTSPIGKSIWRNPFDDQPGDWFQKGAALNSSYRQVLELCGYQHKEMLNSDAGVEFFANNLSEYGTIVLMTHGGLIPADIDATSQYTIFATGTKISVENDQLYASDLMRQSGESCPEIVHCNVDYDGSFEGRYGITPEFFRRHYNTSSHMFNKAFLITNACHSLQIQDMSTALQNCGIYAYAGWNESDSYGWYRNLELLTLMAAGSKLGDAYALMEAGGLTSDAGNVAKLVFEPANHSDYYLRAAGGQSPLISISTPTNNTSTSERILLVQGRITNYDSYTSAKVSLNGVPGKLDLDAYGNFSHEVVIKRGVNTIVVMSTNQSGSSSKVMIINGTMAAQALWTELNWSTDDTDVDLHLLRPNGIISNSYDDCSYFNTNPDWGISGYSDDNPSLDVDDTDGYGPEHITMNSATAGRYMLFVHFFNEHGHNWEYTNARLAISVNEQATKFFGPQILINNSAERTHGDFWFACYIDFPSGQITPIDTVQTRKMIQQINFPEKKSKVRTATK